MILGYQSSTAQPCFERCFCRSGPLPVSSGNHSNRGKLHKLKRKTSIELIQLYYRKHIYQTTKLYVYVGYNFDTILTKPNNRPGSETFVSVFMYGSIWTGVRAKILKFKEFSALNGELYLDMLELIKGSFEYWLKMIIENRLFAVLTLV